MAFDAFMHIDVIQGESSDERHAGWIEIKNFSLGVGQRVSRTASSAGGASAERAVVRLSSGPPLARNSAAARSTMARTPCTASSASATASLA